MLHQLNIIKKTRSHPETRGWFMGNFFPEWDFFHSKNVELKYQTYKKWEKYIGSLTDMPRKTLAILISWSVKVRFPSLWQEFVLDTPFDCIADDVIPWNHEVEAIDDAIVLAIRIVSKYV